ncbi:hypothetical protein LIER_05088 [Lithospermum erythrorhizon]|uniref:Uncharacterized protein n=1 Tax=Lithospermum erythrorhizon TaxID=34254 RepID=A0AAV3NZE6_LITER
MGRGYGGKMIFEVRFHNAMLASCDRTKGGWGWDEWIWEAELMGGKLVKIFGAAVGWWAEFRSRHWVGE